jgi:hypothetical protein
MNLPAHPFRSVSKPLRDRSESGLLRSPAMSQNMHTTAAVDRVEPNGLAGRHS